MAFFKKKTVEEKLKLWFAASRSDFEYVELLGWKLNEHGCTIKPKLLNNFDIKQDEMSEKEILMMIRDTFISDSHAVIVPIGRDTWMQRTVDWAIAAAFISTVTYKKCGVLGLLLPSHPSFRKNSDMKEHILPARIVDNIHVGGACICTDLPIVQDQKGQNTLVVNELIHLIENVKMIKSKTDIIINNSRPLLTEDIEGQWTMGWRRK